MTDHLDRTPGLDEQPPLEELTDTIRPPDSLEAPDPAVAADPDPQAELATLMLGAPVEFTRAEVSALAGISEAEARALWLALGFPEVPAGQPAFTRLDAEALRACHDLLDSGLVDEDTVLVLMRVIGQGLARVAEAHINVMSAASTARTTEEALQVAREGASQVIPILERLIVRVWRRQVAASSARALAVVGRDDLPVVTVGFVDLVDFTSSSRHTAPADLALLLERFEADTSRRVATAGGTVVKTLGDGVMWTCDGAVEAAEIALDSVRAHELDERLPQVRAGLARGPVLRRLGDVFGEPVNLASRLTDQARPGTVLVDRYLAEALAGVPGFDLVPLKQRPVRGYRSLRPHLLRRSPA